MDQYSSMTLQALSIQFLETTYILDNSKNIDTIQSRIGFLETIFENLRPLSSLPDYHFYTQIGIDDFKMRYPNRIPTEENITGLLNPKEFNLPRYCINSIIAGLQRYLNEQFEEIQFLKSKVSKDKRLSKVIHAVLVVKNLLEGKYANSQFYPDAVIEIETIVKRIEDYHETI